MSYTEAQSRNIETLQGAFDNALSANYDKLEPFIDEDFVIYEAEGLPFGGVFRGIEGYVACMKGIAGFWSNSSVTSPQIIPVGEERLIMMSDFRGNIASNGQLVEMPTISVWDFKNGKIAVVRPYFFDTKKIADLAEL